MHHPNGNLYLCRTVALGLVLLLAPEKADAEPFVFKDPELSFQLLRVIGATASGGADVGECLVAAQNTKPGSDESWYEAWHKKADDLDAQAKAFLAAGHRQSAREAFFRACNYYRNAEFFLHADPHDPRILKTARRSRDAFLQAARLSETPIRPVRIPFEDTTLPGYLCLDGSGKKKPLLLAQTGFDGTGEELYFQIARFANERGYHCLIFEGPGQGMALREQHLLFRPNWETVVTPVVDFALKQPEVDGEKIALIGYSMGGYLAPRAAAFEPRISALIADGGVFNFHASTVADLGPNVEKILDDPEQSKVLDKDIFAAMPKSTKARWFFNDGMWKFGAKTPSALLRKTRPYNLKDCADEIGCPTLIIDGELDTLIPGQAKKLFSVLKCPKDYYLFTAEEGAGSHCQVGAWLLSSEVILNWLDQTFACSNGRSG